MPNGALVRRAPRPSARHRAFRGQPLPRSRPRPLDRAPADRPAGRPLTEDLARRCLRRPTRLRRGPSDRLVADDGTARKSSFCRAFAIASRRRPEPRRRDRRFQPGTVKPGGTSPSVFLAYRRSSKDSVRLGLDLVLARRPQTSTRWISSQTNTAATASSPAGRMRPAARRSTGAKQRGTRNRWRPPATS